MMTSLSRRIQLSAIRVVLIHNIDKTISFNLPKSFLFPDKRGCRSFVGSVVASSGTVQELQGPIFQFQSVIFFAKGAIKAPSAEVTHY